MAATTFQERIARIEQRQPVPAEFTPARFAPKPVRAERQRCRSGTGRILVPLATGGVSGILVGCLVQGAALEGAPWGPGTAHNEIAGLLGVGGLLAALPLVLLSVYLRARRPGMFLFAVAYAVLAMAVVLL